MITAYKKVCQCDFQVGEPVAITGMIRLVEKAEKDGGLRYYYEWIPGPSCNICGAPWEETKANERIRPQAVTTVQ